MKRVWIAPFALALAVLIPAGVAVAAIPSGNQVLNPGAEQGVAAHNSTDSPQPMSWDRGVSDATFVRYDPGIAGLAGFPTIAESARIGGGSNFFSGGNENSSILFQFVDLSGASTEVDASQLVVTASACLGGYLTQEDSAQLEISFRDATLTGTLPGAQTIGPVTAAERGNQTKLLLRQKSFAVPFGARRAVVQLAMHRVGLGPYNDGYADNVSLRFGKLGEPVPPAGSCNAPTGGGGGGGGGGGQDSAPVEVLSKSVKLRRGWALVRVRCATREGVSCKGKLRMATASSKSSGHVASTLASAKFNIASGKTKTVKAKLKRSGKRIARLSARKVRKRKVAITVTIGSLTKTATLRLRKGK